MIQAVNNKRCQSSVEFIIILTMMLAIFGSFFSIHARRSGEFEAKKDELLAKSITEDVAFAISEVHIAGNNASKELFLPDMLVSMTYNMTVDCARQVAVISYGERRYDFPLPTSNVTCGIFYPGIIRIENRNGGILVTQ